MSIPKVTDFTCPRCGGNIKITTFDSLNTDYAENVAEQIICGDLFRFECAKCHKEVVFTYDFLYHDLKHGAMIMVAHKQSDNYLSTVKTIRGGVRPPYETFRIVESIFALREKVACLEHNRDDRVIEFCKVFTVYNMLAQQPSAQVSRVFYSVSNDKEYIFLYDKEGKETFCELPPESYDYLKDLYYSSPAAAQFDPNFPIVDYAWAEEILLPLLEAEVNRINAKSATAQIEPQKNGASSKDKLFCPKCKNEVPEDSEFCQFCGSKIAETQTPVAPQHSPARDPKTMPLGELRLYAEYQAKTNGSFAPLPVIEKPASYENPPQKENAEEFGITAEFPVCISHSDFTKGEEEYLSRLRTTYGEKIKWTRRAPMIVPGTNNVLDVFDTFLISGHPYHTIYFKSASYTSKEAPGGFVFYEAKSPMERVEYGKDIAIQGVGNLYDKAKTRLSKLKSAPKQRTKFFNHLSLPKTLIGLAAIVLVLIFIILACSGAFEHKHKYTTKVVPSTCVEAGYTKYTCECGYSYTSNYTSLVAHRYTLSGNTKCSVCGAKKPNTNPVVAEPRSGAILSGKSYSNASEITVKAASGSSCVVKLKTRNGTEVLSFYVRSGETVTVGVPEQYMYVYFASGTTWYGERYLFGDETSYSMDDTICDFGAYTYTYTLYPVWNGNFDQTPIDADDF